MRIFGIDPGSIRTGYGCIDTDGSRCRLVEFGAISLSARRSFPERLTTIFDELTSLIANHVPACVAVEDVFHARNARSALKLGQVRGVALLAAARSGLPVAEYAATEVKKSVVGYGRAEKSQVQQMVALLLGLDAVPAPHDAADALAIAICHAHMGVFQGAATSSGIGTARSWRRFRPTQ